MNKKKMLLIQIDFHDEVTEENEAELEKMSGRFVDKILRYGDDNKIAMMGPLEGNVVV